MTLRPQLLLDAVVDRIGRSDALNTLGRTLNRGVNAVVRRGSLKDLLSGTWLGHPLHPLLTDLPIGAWVSALTLDLVGGTETDRGARILIGGGVLAALPTAVTGLSDLADVEDRHARSVGAVHATGNLGALVLFGLSYLARRQGRADAGRALAALGGAVLTGAGFLGGELAYRKGIGVDHTRFRQDVSAWTAVLDEADLLEGQPRRVFVQSAEIMLVRKGERVFAIANRCSHRGGPLYKGRVEGLRVTCPWHLSTFSLEDGSIFRGPATAPQPIYLARIRDGKVEVRGGS